MATPWISGTVALMLNKKPGTAPAQVTKRLEPVMNFVEGLDAFGPSIGRKAVDCTEYVAACNAALAPPSAERLVWRPLSASRASDRAGRNPEVHNTH